MINQSRSSRLERLKTALNKWRIGFLVFALGYFVILVLNLTNSPMQWDEVTHLNGANFLLWGQFDRYINNMFYPPLFDFTTFVFFKTFGVTLFAARLVPAIFSVLSLWVVFELANTMYNGKTALLSTVLLAITPAYFWLSRIALLETMLVFFTTLSLYFFFRWLQTRKDRMLVFAGLAVGLGFLTKYQTFVAGGIMLASLFFLARGSLRASLKKFLIPVVVAVLVVLPWILVAFQIYESKVFTQWGYALQIGNPERLLYSDRYPMPIYYLIEMVWPYANFHPFSIFLYIAGLAGLGVLAWRRSNADKYVFIWFLGIYLFFTFIENKEWRYVLPLFPALAISASAFFFFFYDRIQNAWKRQINISKKRAGKVAAGVFIALMIGAMAYSVNDAYSYVAELNVNIPIEQATNYAFNRMDNHNQSILVLCPFNLFSAEMVKFYLWADGDNDISTYQYPTLGVDGYTPYFNVTELVGLCKQDNVKFVFTYEYGGTVPYFNTTLNLQQVYEQLYACGNFSHITQEATFGANPRRIFILNFTG
jgi:4-amino-4-deoxy-L-arabinose transferase-like glycosyltransferase